MKQLLFHSVFSIFFLITLLTPFVGSAHEVYVLNPDEIQALTDAPALPFFSIVFENLTATLLWGFMIAFFIISVFLISISATLENKFDRHLIKLKHYAPFIARVTAGIAFISCAYHNALFGPELPLESIFGSLSVSVQLIMAVAGMMMIFGIYSRFAGLIGIALFSFGLLNYGVYMTTYLNYFAEMVVLVLIGGHKLAVHQPHRAWWSITRFLNMLGNKYGELAFFFLRIGFGAGLIYSSIYAKILHNQLAIAVVSEFGLDAVFGLSPEFIVIGAAIIEILLGLFIILGIEIRFNAVVLNIFLTLSLLYFGESVWPHIILIGIPIAFFCYGYDKYSLEGYFFKKGNREPIF